MKIEVGKYYCAVMDGEYILVEEISVLLKDETPCNIRVRSTRNNYCGRRHSTGICRLCVSDYHNCYSPEEIKQSFKEISKAKGILLLGELDEKL